MPMRPAKRLPARLRRPVSPGTRALVERRYARRKVQRSARYRRFLQKVVGSAVAARKRLAALLLGIALVVLLVFLGVALFSPAMRVTEVRMVRTDPRVDLEQVQTLLSPLFGRHLMLLSTHDVRELLERGMHDLHRVAVDKDYPSALVVRITPDPLVARLSIAADAADAAVATGATVDFLTDQGVYISSSRVSAGEDLPLITIVDWGARPVSGTAIIAPAMLERMTLTERLLLEQFGQETLSRTVYMRGQEYHVRIAQWTIWFDMRSSLDEHLQRYRLFLREIPPADVRSYVDLRLTNRIVHR